MARLVGVRESFAAKLLSALLGTVGLLLLVTFVVVRGETARQVEAAAERAIRSAETQFAELDALQRQLTAQLARPFTEGTRAAPLLEEAIASGDFEYFAGQAEYELDLAQLEDVALTFTDAWGEPLFTLDGGSRTADADPLGVGAMAAKLLEGTDYELRGFRVMGSRMYGVTTQVIETIAGVLVGTVSFGLPVSDADVARIGSVVGVEVCIVAGGACVAGTPLAKESLAPVLVARAGAAGELRAGAADEEWSVRAAPLVPEDPDQGWRVVAVPLDTGLYNLM